MVASTEERIHDATDTTDNSDNRRNRFAGTVADAVRRHLDGDRGAMNEIVDLVTPWLLQLARGYRLNTFAAEDVVQNTLLAFWQHAARLRDPQTALGWLSVVARHEALRVIRSNGRAVPVGDLTALDGAGEGSGPDRGPERARDEYGDPERVVLANADRRVLIKNLALLPARNRELLRMAFLADVRDYATISAALDMPVGSIGPTRRRGLEKLRDLLSADADWSLDESA